MQQKTEVGLITVCSSLDRKAENNAIVFLKVARVGEFETDFEREFQIFGPSFEVVNCLMLGVYFTTNSSTRNQYSIAFV